MTTTQMTLPPKGIMTNRYRKNFELTRSPLALFQSSVAFALMFATIFMCDLVHGQSQRKKIITRVFWQDLESDKLAYADLATTDKWHINRGRVQGFPDTDSSNQQLGPMQQIGKTLMVAVNATNGTDENNKSKLVAIDSGVSERPHGNHSHWEYTSLPQAKNTQPINGSVRDAMVINNQYCFGLSNQRYAMADPNQMMFPGAVNAMRMVNAGGDNGSMAIAANGFAFATWPDTDGEQAGRVDMLNLMNPTSTNSFKVGSAGISAVVANSGKVFFAHEGGLSWIGGNQVAGQQNPTTRKVLNSETESKPTQLINQRNWVLYSEGGEQPALCMCNALLNQPAVIKLPIPDAGSGLRLSAPKTKLSLGKRFAFAFLERTDASSDAQEKLVVFELDPNRDLDFSDARIAKQIPVDASKIKGDRGHHEICFDAFGRFAIFTNPGDGLLSVMTLNDLTVRVRFRVGGVPERVVAVGAAEHFH